MQIYESNICNEFLEDYRPNPSLLPPHPAVRARARIIVATFSEKFVPAFYKLLLRWKPASSNDLRSPEHSLHYFRISIRMIAFPCGHILCCT